MQRVSMQTAPPQSPTPTNEPNQPEDVTPTPEEVSAEDEANQGVFRRWFPGWSGWYGSSATVVSDVDKKVETFREKDLEIGNEPFNTLIGSM